MKKKQHLQRRRYTAEFYRNNRLNFALALFATAIISAVNLAMAWLIQQMLDTASGVSGAYRPSQLLWLAVGIVLFIIAAKSLDYLSKPRFIQKAMQQYKNATFQKLTQKSISSFEREATAAYLSAFTNDVTSIEENYVANIFELLFECVMLVGAFTLMLWYSPFLTMMAIGFYSLPILASLLFSRRMERAEVRVSKRNGHFLAMMKDGLTGFPVIKSFKAEGAVMQLFREENEELEREKCSKRRVSTVLSMLGGVAGVTAQFGTFLAGICLILSGKAMTPGVLVLFMELNGSIINQINTLPNHFAKRKAAGALIDRLAEALEANVREEGAKIPAQLSTGITLENVSFGYTEDGFALQDISVHFQRGRSYAVVGASGSGKSTLLKLLMASHTGYRGSIWYDRHELRTIHSASLYDLSALIQQEVFVFDDTIRNNITLFQPFSEEAVSEAIDRAGLSALIREKGAGYLCGENGNSLSGGERQRIAIARSLLRRTSVLLVDEATAALDPETARRVMDSILELRELTRIVVTHSLDGELLRKYDEILVLKKGRLVERGRYDALMENKSDFFALYTAAQ